MSYSGPWVSNLYLIRASFFAERLFWSRNWYTRGIFWALAALGALLWTAPVAGAAGRLAFSPSAVNFGSVPLETARTMAVALRNSGTSSIAVSKVAISSNQFAIVGLKLPIALAPAASVTITLRYIPTVTGTAQGTIDFYSNASNRTASFSLAGSGIRSALEAIPGSVWIRAAVGAANSQAIQLKNFGTSNLTVSAVTSPAGGISVTGLTLPMTLAPGKTTMFDIKFAPKAAGVVSGAVLITNSSAILGIPVVGSGTASAPTLSVSATSVSFGSVAVGSTASQNVTLMSSGNSSVTVSSISTSGRGINASGLGSAITLNPGQSASLTLKFAPTAAGSITGSVTLKSNATNSPTTISVSGIGASQATSHSVALSWMASVSFGVTGYNIYRSTASGGPYAKLVSFPVSAPHYTDSTVHAGTAYFYVVTAVNSSGEESSQSSQTEAQIP